MFILHVYTLAYSPPNVEQWNNGTLDNEISTCMLVTIGYSADGKYLGVSWEVHRDTSLGELT